jgi:hypothetical protein
MAKKASSEVLAEVEEGAIEKVEEESSYAMVNAPVDDVRDIIALNLAGKQITPFDLDRIRIPDGESDFWTVPTLEGTEAKEEISGVVIHFQDLRAWWPSSDITGDPPSCRSDDTKVGFGARACDDNYPEETEMRSLEPHDCATCLYSQWESDPKAGRGQWCKQMRALFLLTERMYLPMVMFLPPTSIKAVEKYFFRAGAYGEPFNSMVTSFKLVKEKNPDGKKYNRAEPSCLRPLTPVERNAFKAYSESYMAATAK